MNKLLKVSFLIFQVRAVDALREKNQRYFMLIDAQMAITEATDHSYMDGMLTHRNPGSEVPTSGSHRTTSWGGSKEVIKAGQRRRRLIHECMIGVGPGGRRETKKNCEKERGLRRLTKHVFRVIERP